VLVVLVIFVFLRNVPATIIPSISVPVSLIGTLAIMYELNYSIDNLSLMALIIATGFVVDDSIVMIENIVRYLEEGKTPLEAALEGAGQIGFTIMSLTISLIAVLIPLLFMGGVIGRLFSEFAVTLAVTIVLSAVVVSLTLVPMMCARILRRKAERTRAASSKSAKGCSTRPWRPTNAACAGCWPPDPDLDGRDYYHGADAILYITIPRACSRCRTSASSRPSASPTIRCPTGDGGAPVALAEAILKDADVTSLTSYIGIDGTNTTLNNGRFLINLKATAIAR
jgi:multidrug efflux pump